MAKYIYKCNVQCVTCCSITITTKGKYTALGVDAIPPLVKLVDDPTSEVRANVLKVTPHLHSLVLQLELLQQNLSFI